MSVFISWIAARGANKQKQENGDHDIYLGKLLLPNELLLSFYGFIAVVVTTLGCLPTTLV
jgi:hypothetical protein